MLKWARENGREWDAGTCSVRTRRNAVARKANEWVVMSHLRIKYHAFRAGEENPAVAFADSVEHTGTSEDIQ